MKNIIFTIKAPIPLGAYSQGILFNNIIFISGQIPIHPVTGIIHSKISEQTLQVLTNIESILIEVKCDISNIIKTTVFLTNLDDYNKMNIVYRNFFLKKKLSYPARSCIEVSRLPKDVKIEIEAIAVKNKKY
ncbi:hypothetical protein GJT88_00775 [Enterobacteriaceae endosymbiont of Donacia tomentosa]|uniref:Rid family detoxifying hydrolase n=1 Tax=Enterobacteriaceae endosymbiont of Donacia tomentosa TaxID=2675787 RepID=UPI0014491932|nr:Rid family detoxifying hydrolase [Enterobacteriaceae endosymbiont of Donacia tomentosa]QJC31598.1 hypothetical protein GJT88_00775 [Enterobacteriaceae endosymbiont of Donacia tomentosa]